MMMGMEEDPEDHTAVASAVFISVAVYAVSGPSFDRSRKTNTTRGF